MSRAHRPDSKVIPIWKSYSVLLFLSLGYRSVIGCRE